MRWNRLGQSLLLLCCAHTLLVQSQKRDSASRSADPAAACTVQIQGRPDGSLAQAQLSCSGGIVTVAADIPAARSQLQTLSSSKGVTWVAGSCGLMPKTCTLAICSAKDSSGADIPLRLSLTVNNYTDTTEGMWGVVCITGKTRADVKGAVITGNDVAGLVLNGSADVTITDSSFVGNERKYHSGAALIAAGRSRLRVERTQFVNNSIEARDEEAGAVLLQDNASATFVNSTFHNNQAYFGHGGALHAGDNVNLTITGCSFTQHIGTQGGVLRAMGKSKVTILDSTLRENWASWGGAIYAANNSSVMVRDSELTGNYVKDYDNPADGGACYLWDSAELHLHNVSVHNNIAQNFGGGIAMGTSSATLVLGPGTSITGNSARQGGGLYITRVLDNMTHAAHITVRNKAVVSDDIGTELVSLELLSARNVSNFVPRLGDNKGLLPVKLKLSGKDGLPAAAAIQAVLDGRPLARNSSDPVTGEALLDINLQKPPGTYLLTFEVMAMNDELNTNMSVTVVSCGPGEVAVADEDACNTCPKGSYSLDPLAEMCSPCPRHAACDDGMVIPVAGYWSSSLGSNQTHRCLYPPACTQKHTDTELESYRSQMQDPITDAAFLVTQCAVGHTGNLCAGCSKGYGQRMSATASKCSPCASSGQIITLYILATLASMFVIRLLCHLNSVQPTAAAQAAPGQGLPTANTSSVTASALKLRLHDSDAAMGHSIAKTTKPKDQDNSINPGSPPVGTSGPSQAQSGTLSGLQNAQSSAASVVAPTGAGPNVLLGDLLKPFVVYLQWLLVVASINVEYPRAIAAPFSAVAWLFATGSTATGLDCLLTQRDSRVTIAVQKVLLGLLMPLLVLVMLVVLDAIVPYVRRWLRTRHRPHWRQRQRQSGVYARTTIVLVFFFLPSLLRTAYGMFACVRLDRKPAVELTGTFFRFNAIGSFWLMDTSQRCFEGVHRGWAAGLGAPLLILLCGVVPFGIMFFLWYRRSELQASYYQEHYGFLYRSYNPKLCFWEGVVALQTCLVVAISVFGVTLGAEFQCILLTAAFGASLLLLAAFRPFSHHAANLVGIQGCACLLVSVQAALAIHLLTLEGSENTAAATGVAVAVLCVNLIFALSFLWRVLHAIDWTGISRVTRRVAQCAAGHCSKGRR